MKRRATDALSRLTVERDSRLPLHQQLYRALRNAIRRGQLPAGSRLPASRTLAQRVGVSRNTVLNAYEALIADGLAEGKVGAGTRVSATRLTPRLSLRDPDGNTVQVVE